MKTNHLVVVFNGEIYNYLELKKDLEAKGHHFQTNSDTEVLLHGYEEYHYDIVNHLRGMFALHCMIHQHMNYFVQEIILELNLFTITMINSISYLLVRLRLS